MNDIKELFKMGGTISKKTDTIVFIIGAIIMLLFWYIITSTGDIIPKSILPNPIDVLSNYKYLYQEKNLLGETWFSIKLNLVGYLYAILISIPLGFILGLFPITRSLFSRIFDALRFVPLPACQGIFIAIFGLTFSMKSDFLAFGILIYILPVVVQRVISLQDPKNDKEFVFLQTAKTLGATKLQTFRFVYYPYVMRKIIDDIRVLTAISWTYLTIVEIIYKDGAGENGIGSLISVLNRQSQTVSVYAIIFEIVAIGILQDMIWRFISWLFFPDKHNRRTFNLNFLYK